MTYNPGLGDAGSDPRSECGCCAGRPAAKPGLLPEAVTGGLWNPVPKRVVSALFRLDRRHRPAVLPLFRIYNPGQRREGGTKRCNHGKKGPCYYLSLSHPLLPLLLYSILVIHIVYNPIIEQVVQHPLSDNYARARQPRILARSLNSIFSLNKHPRSCSSE
jgi:hypothetical protein